jgi:hypothetical protein
MRENKEIEKLFIYERYLQSRRLLQGNAQQIVHKPNLLMPHVTV